MERTEYKTMFEVEEQHFWFHGMRLIVETFLNKYLVNNSQNCILEAGCGTGSSLVYLKKFGKPIGVDISPLALMYCKKRGLKKLKRCSIENLPFENNTFDLVTCFDVICQDEVKNDNYALHEFYRVLKPGGLLFIRVPAYRWLRSYHDIFVHTSHRYTRKELQSLLEESNFSILKISYLNTILFPIVVIKRLILRIYTPSHSDVMTINPFINALFIIPFTIENLLIRFINFPFGVSIFAVAKK